MTPVLAGPHHATLNLLTGGDERVTITDRAVYKSSPSAPEMPMVHARVLVLRKSDGKLMWAGWSDDLGYYTARGLEPLTEYVVLGVDMRRPEHIPASQPGLFKATGAGAVMTGPLP